MTTEEQVYCLQFELTTLSRIVNLGELERWTPGFCGANTHLEHIKRYQWVSQMVGRRDVVDIACGVGRGSRMLAEEGQADSVLGVDLCEEAVKYAAIKNRNERVSFEVGDATSYQPSRKMDIVVSFETIEHIPDVEAYLRNVRNMLKGDGIFIVSTPVAACKLDEHPANACHVREWGFRSFQNMVERHFKIDEVWVQFTPVSVGRKRRLLDKIAGRKRAKIEAYELLRWSEEAYPANDVGTVYHGYQVLVCKA